MNNKSALLLDYKTVAGNILSWIFGLGVLALGIINIFWGNDQAFGSFLILLSFVYFPPTTRIISKIIGFSIPVILKIALAIFVIWASVGVGELFDKIDLMMKSF
jgi:hypothetical protein